jgi:hypothetical protein
MTAFRKLGLSSSPWNDPPLPAPISLAVRAFPDAGSRKTKSDGKPWHCPKAVAVFDTETRTDPTQSLTFGSYRFFVKGRCLEEVLFYADDLPATDLATLQEYVSTHSADTERNGNRELKLLPLNEFLGTFFRDAYKSRCLVVGFNLPFDFSRLAFESVSARGAFVGGFSLGLWSYRGKNDKLEANPFRPRIAVKHIDSKRAIKAFTGRNRADDVDRIPEGSPDGKPQKNYIFRGHFLDLRTLAFALTDRGYTLETACQEFGVEHGKQKSAVHGIVSEEYIGARDEIAGRI